MSVVSCGTQNNIDVYYLGKFIIFIHIHLWQGNHVLKFDCQELSMGCGNFKHKHINYHF